MDVDALDIRELIPQREPFIMLDGVLAVKEKGLRSFFVVRAGNVLVKEDSLRESGLIENIAQTAAAMNGYAARMEGTPVKLGFIGGIKNLEIFALPQLGNRLETEVEEIHFVMNTSIIIGRVWCEGRLMASCEMKVFMQD